MKLLCRILALCAVCLVAASGCVVAHGEPIQTDRSCSLTLTYQREGETFVGLDIRVYRVADLSSWGEFTLAAPFDRYPVDVKQVTAYEQWNTVAATLMGYARADGVEPHYAKSTNAHGQVRFGNLKSGLYLVEGVVTDPYHKTHIFHDCVFSLPAVKDGVVTYDLVSTPKAKAVESTDQEQDFTVVKLWQDLNQTQHRPQSVTVDIVKDGELYETVVLSSQNQWRHTVDCPNGNYVWRVAERDVPAGYTVSVIEKETAFILVNTYGETVPNPPSENGQPQTGESFYLPYVVAVLLGSGLICLVLGIMTGSGRHEN